MVAIQYDGVGDLTAVQVVRVRRTLLLHRERVLLYLVHFAVFLFKRLLIELPPVQIERLLILFSCFLAAVVTAPKTFAHILVFVLVTYVIIIYNFFSVQLSSF